MLPSHRVRLRALPAELRGKGSTFEGENKRQPPSTNKSVTGCLQNLLTLL